MAGDWIKFEISTSEKPEVWAMAQALGIDADAVVGKLLRVWAWFDQQTPDGNAASVTSALPSRYQGVTSGVTKALLDRRVSVTGFCDAMISVGWMIESEGVVSLPNFDRHNGKTAKTRGLTAKRVASHKAKSNAGSVTSSVSDALPREEKRREEKSNHYVSLSLLGIKHFEFLSENTVCPEWLAPEFCRWLAFRFSRDAVKVDEILQETWIKRLIERGKEKSLADIDFSISKQAKNLLHVENDFDKIAKAKLESAKNPQGRETRGDKARQLIEDIKNGRV
jgi:hypothetical protein